MKQSDIRGFFATYHRNGIGGAPFYLCSFYTKDGKDLRAVVFDEKITWRSLVATVPNAGVVMNLKMCCVKQSSFKKKISQ